MVALIFFRFQPSRLIIIFSLWEVQTLIDWNPFFFFSSTTIHHLFLSTATALQLPTFILLRSPSSLPWSSPSLWFQEISSSSLRLYHVTNGVCPNHLIPWYLIYLTISAILYVFSMCQIVSNHIHLFCEDIRSSLFEYMNWYKIHFSNIVYFTFL